MPVSSTVWERDPHTQAKHEILQNYLEAWFPILSKYSGRIIYLDGFAGPGTYIGREDGSPVIALRTAASHVLRHRFHGILFIFIEKEIDRATILKDVLKARFPSLPPNLKYEVIGAEFAPTLESTLESLEKEGAKLAPTFAFLDPFGFSGFPMNLIGRMMSYDKCEVLITFMEGFVNRFNDESQKPSLNELYATDEWQKLHQITDPEQRRKFLLNLYERQLRDVGRATYVRSFEMIGEHNQPIYYLIFGTKHPKGLEVMKEAMWTVDRRGTYRFSDITDIQQSYLIDYQAESHWVPSAAEMVFSKFRGKTVAKSEIVQFVITETPFLYRKAILEYLERAVAPKITKVTPPRKRAYSYPNGCSVTFKQ